MSAESEPWFAVRCVFRFHHGEGEHTGTYEERITLWRASSFDEAIERAEVEAHAYADTLGGEYLDLAQAFHLAVGDSISDGDEVFSLMRDSDLAAAPYMDLFFDTGSERQAD